MTITKLTIVALALSAVMALVLLYTRTELVVSGIGSQTVFSNRDPYGSVRPLKATEKVNWDLLTTDKERLSILGKSSQTSEELAAEPKGPSPGLSPQLGLPAEIATGVEAPWAWIERLDPLKQAAIERAFSDAAVILRASVAESASPDDPRLEASMARLEQDVTARFKSILSPQEFESYLLSLPDDALERLGFETSGN